MIPNKHTGKVTSAAIIQLPACRNPSAHVNISYLLSDFFGDRVFNLESRVDLDEVVFAVSVHQELHGPCVLVANLQTKKKESSELSK